MRLLVLAALVLSSTLACNPKHDKPVGLDLKSLQKSLNDPRRLSYPDVEKFVLKPHCINCHNPGTKKGGVDISSFDKLLNSDGKSFLKPFFPEESSVFTTLNAKGDLHMPPLDKPQLLPEQKLLVYQWIKNGAPAFRGQIVTQPPSLEQELTPYFGAPETIDYAVVNKYVFSTSCNDCHSLSGSKPDKDAIKYNLNLSSYHSLVNTGEGIVKGKPDQSSAFYSIATEQTMPPLAKGYKLMDPYRTMILRLWILNCSIEDYSQMGEEELLDDKDSPQKRRLCEGQE